MMGVLSTISMFTICDPPLFNFVRNHHWLVGNFLSDEDGDNITTMADFCYIISIA